MDARRRRAGPLPVHLCGDEREITDILVSLGISASSLCDQGIAVEHCPEIVSPDDIPSRVWRTKSRCSIVRCIALQKEGVVDVSLSAGDTRIIVGAAMFLLGKCDGVTRPALGALLPTTADRPSLLLDVGANLNCRAEHLVAFGLLGYNYMKHSFSVGIPSVALLNIGEESSKGTRAIVEADKELATKCRGYRGFIEGSRTLSGDVDVIVCDGFVGNVLLKACESFHVLTESVLSGNVELIETLRNRMTILNAENYGAIPLLGVRGVVMKAHGASSARAISYALGTAVRAVERDLPGVSNCEQESSPETKGRPKTYVF